MIYTKLVECCTFIKDGTHSSPTRVRDGIPVLSAINVVDGRLNFDTDRFTTMEELNLFRKRLYPQKGDVLLTIVGTIGRTAILTESKSLVFQRSVCVLRPQKSILDSVYLRYVLESVDVKRQLEQATHEVAQAGVYLESLNQIDIPLPPLPEQKRIAAILEKADRLRRLRRYALELSGTYLQSVFLEMFGNPGKNTKNWQTGRLYQLCRKIIDCPHSTPIYSPTLTEYACIRSSDIQDGVLDWSTTKYVDYNEYQKRIQICAPMPNDVVYCREGARFGNAAIIPQGKKVCLGQRIMLFRAASDVATPEFIWAFLESASTYRQANRLVGGSASPHLNVGDIKEFIVIMPPLPLQQQYTEIVQKYERLRTQQREAARQAEHLFQTLLHKAFQGELTAADEADVLAAHADVDVGTMGTGQRVLGDVEVPEPVRIEGARQMVLPME